ncbi:unnamed protein product [Eruca vesicaria subsp. sativa]|uniref:TF-B3 domain-containing protein n=1 Tax=Eruca vesicaria subsp. sativa TaxID=29727 RepID=A0ABC8IM96_ERUVS|nr:unnamed protein product [Eruca vesicaria subsp. sativa]
MLLAFGDDDEIRARRVQEEQDRNFLMIDTITNTFSLGKRKIDDHDQSKNQEKVTASSSSSLSLVESKKRRVVVSDDKPIRAEPIREIKPPVKERKGPVKQKEPVRRELGVTPGWLVELMRRKKGVDAKLVIEKVITKSDLKPEQGRFLIPFKQITEDDFLNEAELNIVEEYYSGDGEKGVDVILLNSNDAEKKWNANLRVWRMKSSFNYALCSGWNLFVRENDIEVNQTRRLWSFHSRDGKLFLAFDPQPQYQDQDEAMALIHDATSSSMSPDVTRDSYNPFVCEETNKRLYPFTKRRRTLRVCVRIITRDSGNLFEGLEVNRTQPEECTEMAPNVVAVQETMMDPELRL